MFGRREHLAARLLRQARMCRPKPYRSLHAMITPDHASRVFPEDSALPSSANPDPDTHQGGTFHARFVSDERKCDMNLIPTRVHGFLDYTVGLLLIVAPWLLGFSHHGIATWLPVILGAGAIGYSLFTCYELGLVKAIPMPAHLTLDAMSGLLLAASPWIFGFSHFVK